MNKQWLLARTPPGGLPTAEAAADVTNAATVHAPFAVYLSNQTLIRA